MDKIAVLGGGSWATAIVKILTETQESIVWYMRDEEAIKQIELNKRNPKYLSSLELKTEKIILTNEINKAFEEDILIFVIPSAYLEKEMNKANTLLTGKLVISAIKGVIGETGQLITDYFNEKHSVSFENIGVICGPCHAEEVALEKLSFLTVACQDISKAKKIAKVLDTKYIKVRISKDIVGLEYAAVLKNIYAIIMGVVNSRGYGDNFLSVMMSNAIQEMNKYINYIDQEERNINETAYLGDLLVTGYSTFSRNRMLGNMLGKGYSVKSAIMEMNMVAEGYYASKSIYQKIKKDEKKFPIIKAVYKILHKQGNLKKTIKELINTLT